MKRHGNRGKPSRYKRRPRIWWTRTFYGLHRESIWRRLIHRRLNCKLRSSNCRQNRTSLRSNGRPGVLTWLEVFGNLAIGVPLRTFLTDLYIRWILLSERIIVLWQSGQVTIILIRKPVNAIVAESKEADNHTIPDLGRRTMKHYQCRLVGQVTISGCLQAAVLINCRDTELMTTEAHPHVVEHLRSMAAQGLMDALPSTPFYF